jgi:hypothetical protein
VAEKAEVTEVTEVKTAKKALNSSPMTKKER